MSIDEYSQFRRHLIRARNRAKVKNIEFNLTLEDLCHVWEKQQGKCRYTNWKLVPYITTDKRHGLDRHNFASLDRIDSSRGYLPDNIQFVCMMAQFCKSDFDEKYLFEFASSVHGKLKYERAIDYFHTKQQHSPEIVQFGLLRTIYNKLKSIGNMICIILIHRYNDIDS